MKKKMITACFLAWLGTAGIAAQGFPMDSIYTRCLEDMQVPAKVNYALRPRIVEHTDLSLPAKDVLQLSFKEMYAGMYMQLTFRFRPNYEALAAQLDGLGYGPVRANYGTSEMVERFLPEKGLKVSLGVAGKVAPNGMADYVYAVQPMTPNEKAGFFTGADGRWNRFLLGEPTVLLPSRSNFPDQKRTLRASVLPADSLRDYLAAPVTGAVLRLQATLPRRDVPAVGQVYATTVQDNLFPYGFVGKVASLRREGKELLVEFMPAGELEVFDIE